MELMQLQIGFENCEVITLTASEVASIYIDEITKTLAKDWYTNRVTEKTRASNMTLILLPDANHPYQEQA